MKKKYLSDVLSAKELLESENNRICIVAGVGAGKNTFVTEQLKGYGNIFFVSSRRATVNQMKLLKEICKEKVDWNNFTDEILTTTNYGIEQLVKNEKFSTTGIRNIIEHYDLIIIDEFHSLKADATFANATFHVYSFLDYISENYPDKKIIVMTGTVDPVIDILKRDNYDIIDKTDECINVMPDSISVIKRTDAIQIANELPSNEKTVYYTNSAHGIMFKDKNRKPLFNSLCEMNTYNVDNIAFAMADETASSIMKEANVKPKKKGTKVSKKSSEATQQPSKIKHIENLDRKVRLIKEYIIRKKKLPNKTKLLITTSTLKEGINIKTKDIKIAFCESHLLSDIQQFAGRFREGLKTLYIINDAKQFDITDEQHRKNFLEIFYNAKALKRINDFFNNQIKNEESIIYYKGFGSYNLDELKFYNALLSEDWSIYSTTESAKVFIDMIEEKYRYIRYNHLNNQFEIFFTAFREQLRIYQFFASGWETEVCDYCKQNNIKYTNLTASKNVDILDITEYLKSYINKKLFDDVKNNLLEYLRISFGRSRRPQPSTCNKLFEEYNIPYRLVDGHSGNRRYIIVVPLKNV